MGNGKLKVRHQNHIRSNKCTVCIAFFKKLKKCGSESAVFRGQLVRIHFSIPIHLSKETKPHDWL